MTLSHGAQEISRDRTETVMTGDREDRCASCLTAGSTRAVVLPIPGLGLEGSMGDGVMTWYWAHWSGDLCLTGYRG